MTIFPNRTAAGQELALRFHPTDVRDAVLVAIPNGGVPVALPIAGRLHLPVHVCVAAKIHSPQDSRMGMGAVGLFTHHFNDELLQVYGVSRGDLAAETLAAFGCVRCREELFVNEVSRKRGLRFLRPEIEDRAVILVDDGLATGYTALAAIARFQHSSPRRVIVAAPVCSAYVRATLDQVPVSVQLVTLVESSSTHFYVDEHYADFRQLFDDDALRAWNSQPLAEHAGVLTEAMYGPRGLIEPH